VIIYMVIATHALKANSRKTILVYKPHDLGRYLTRLVLISYIPRILRLIRSAG
jgi:hypothetical protein